MKKQRCLPYLSRCLPVNNDDDHINAHTVQTQLAVRDQI